MKIGGKASNTRHGALLIESDEAYRAAMLAVMRLAGCEVQHVLDWGRALPVLERRRFDVLVWGVPSRQAAEHQGGIAELRLRSQAPLVVLAAGSDAAQADLEAGADQFLAKPFVPGALLGALKAALRHGASSAVPAIVQREIRGLILDGEGRTVSFRSGSAELTRQEWDLLTVLVDHANRYLTAQDIMRLGFRTGEYGPEQVRTYVRRLRGKLEPLQAPCELLSRHGHGYCLMFN